MLFVMGVGFLLDSPLIVFHSMCVFRLWSQCPSRCSFHMPDLCVCMAWLMSLFKCYSLLSVGSFALIMSRSFICALMFSGNIKLLKIKNYSTKYASHIMHRTSIVHGALTLPLHVY